MTQASSDAPLNQLPGETATGASHELQRIRREIPTLLSHMEALLKSGQTPFLRTDCTQQKIRVHKLSPEETGQIGHWFFIGDIHGDFYALYRLINAAENLDAECRILFLGDIADRGHLPFECIFLLVDWALRHPGRLAWIAGNHDIAYSRAGEHFTSACSPAEMLEELNRKDELTPLRQRIGDMFIRLAARLPRALLFPEGLLATHGGMPHSDLQKQATHLVGEAEFMEWLNSDDCLEDFTWNRISRYPRKLPDRHSSGPEYGFKDFEAFCELNPAVFPVTAMVTGHEHAEDGADTNPSYTKYPALTLLGQGFSDLIDRKTVLFYTGYRKVLRLGRGVAGRAPDVIDIAVDHLEMLDVYREQLGQAAHDANRPSQE